MALMFNESGCEECRDAWGIPNRKGWDATIEGTGRINMERQAELYRCRKCGQFWEDPNGNHPCGITNEEARKYYGAS